MDIATNSQDEDILVVAHSVFLDQFYLKWEHNNKVFKIK